jgi:hypothetical protein
MKDDRISTSNDDGYSYLDPLILQQRRYTILVVGAVSILAVFAALAAYFLERPIPVKSEQLIAIVTSNIRSQIDTSADLQFDDLRVEPQGSDTYIVKGSVDAISGGETGRFKFSCLIRRGRDGAWMPNEWQVTRLR